MTEKKPDLAEIRKQHVARMREDVLRIQEFAGYVLARIDKGHAESADLQATEIVSAGQRLMTGCATIGALDILDGQPSRSVPE